MTKKITFHYQTPGGAIEEAEFDTLDDAARAAWQRVLRGFREESSMGIVRIEDADGTVYDDDDLENLRLQRERDE